MDQNQLLQLLGNDESLVDPGLGSIFGNLGNSINSAKLDYSTFTPEETAFTSFMKGFLGSAANTYGAELKADAMQKAKAIKAIEDDKKEQAKRDWEIDSYRQKQAIDTANAGLKKRQEILGENAAWMQAFQPAAAEVQPIGQKEDGSYIYDAFTPAQSGKLDSSTNPNNPFVKAQKDAQDKLESQKKDAAALARSLEGDTYNRITKLPSYTQFADIDANFRTAKELAKQDTIPASIGMISAVARVWDPGGTVKEGEYQLNANAQSALDSLTGGMWRKSIMGEGQLSADTKAKMLQAIGSKYNEFGQKYLAERDALYGALEQQGGSRKNIPTPGFDPYSFSAPISDKKAAAMEELRRRGVKF